MTTATMPSTWFKLSTAWLAKVIPMGFYVEEARTGHGRHTFDVRFYHDVPGVVWDGIGTMSVRSAFGKPTDAPDFMAAAHAAISFLLDEIERGEASEVWGEVDFPAGVQSNTDGSGHHLESSHGLDPL